MDENTIYILQIIDWAVFCIGMLSVFYLLAFSFASLFTIIKKIPSASSFSRFLVIFPAYKEDRVILDSVNSFLLQKYPRAFFDIVVVSDHIKEETNEALRSLPIKLLIASYENSSKAKALKLAVEGTIGGEYDMVVIMDADNTADEDFLSKINDAGVFQSAIQAHRTGKNRNTDTAVLDAVSEEINNSIFRKGHINLGLSSALIGSGMAFDYNWFKENVGKLATSGEDKELELLLLKQRVHISYLDKVYVYDEKTQKSSGFYNQRRRWIATQFYSLGRNFVNFFPALFHWNIDYMDKLIQWTLPPRIVHVGLIGLIALVLTFIDFSTALKWWILLGIMVLTLCIAIPGKLWDKKLLKAIVQIPLLFIMMVANLFRVKGADKNFIHTQRK